MARSSSLYAVFLEEQPIAGFTVRHELVTWLKKQIPEILHLLTVYKFYDGTRINASTGEDYAFDPFEVDIVELITEK